MLVWNPADAALKAPSGYSNAVKIKKTLAVPCEPPLTPFTQALDFTSKYEGSGAARDEINEESDAQYQEQIKPITDMERRVTSLVTRYMKYGESAQLECILDLLTTWADAGALEGEAPNHTGKSMRKWSLGSLSGAYLRLKFSSSQPLKNYTQQSQKIEAWFGAIADRVKQEWLPDAPLDKINNHYYWAAWAMMATAAATNRQDLFDRAAALYRIFAGQVDAEGYLPNELVRASRAVQYHAYSMLPITMVAAFGRANDVELAAEGNGALLRLAQRVQIGLTDPSSFAEKAKAAQDASSTLSTANWAWLEPFCWTQPCTPGLAARLTSVRPLAVTRLGGDLTAIFKAQPGLTPVPPADVRTGIGSLIEQCRIYINGGDYEEALRRCKSAQSNAERLAPNSEEHVTSIVGIGDLKRLERNYVDADVYYTKALQIVDSIQDTQNPPDPAPLLDKLVDIKVKRGKLLEAQILASRLQKMKEAQLGPRSVEVAKLRARDADLLSQSHQFPEAEQAYMSAIDVLEHAGASNYASYAQTLQRLAETYERQGKYQRAEGQYRKLLAVVEGKKSGMNWDVLTLDRLGYVCEQLEKPAEALAFYEREMSLLRASGAPEEVAQSLQIKLSRLASARQTVTR